MIIQRFMLFVKPKIDTVITTGVITPYAVKAQPSMPSFFPIAVAGMTAQQQKVIEKDSALQG